ncbi:uncharacterized protein BT62DRAFT_1013596 [Guyanagaster necrorhizus]|uniref:Thiaminase-2/PQQC domain-containing protein n=1 Tax=Guyanagaster necrorhizus TaxID=856835 RepID=A0A9P7VFN7_9AGAR|nr:uncharacterized protein BT62DRAFT_1013596 [Guyanagaster necrorhizus MCA 3950]KAG7439712.1 hypothetical protein BT62DRAFT_1013596 [Guyanagaster necrorhizus MCA 3950]
MSRRAAIIIHALESQKGPFKLKAPMLDADGTLIKKRDAPTLIEELIAENEEVWNNFLTNEFCTLGYKTPASDFDDTYRDYLYLIEYVRFVHYRDLQEPSAHTKEGLVNLLGSVSDNVDYVEGNYETCITPTPNGIGIPEEELLNEKPSPALLGYTSWEQLSGITDDSFSNFVRAIPCVYGWNKIAEKLQSEGDGEQGTLFYKSWFQANLDDSYASTLSEYLEANHSTYDSPGNKDKWSVAFHEACQFETALFAAGL